MKAAVVHTCDLPPRYDDFEGPTAHADEVIVQVRAAALSQLVRAQASGRHYTSGKPPFVPGADGVGTLENGQRVYFAFPRGPVGAMAERVAVNAAYTVALPDSVDDVTAAAIANPGMSSWAALTDRAHFQKGETVLINGATGASGRLAIQIAKYLGAARVIATGRNQSGEAVMRTLGADDYVALDQSPAELASRFRSVIDSGVDIVLDYLWGASAEIIMAAANSHAPGAAARRLRFVNIGALSGATIVLSAMTMRSGGVELTGSGLGSVSNVALVRSIAGVMQAISPAHLSVDARGVPLREVEAVWQGGGSDRIVFTL